MEISCFYYIGCTETKRNDKVVLNQAYKGLYVYRTDTMEAGRVLEQEVTGYCIDEIQTSFLFCKREGIV